MVVGAKVCELTDGFFVVCIRFVCENYDVSPNHYQIADMRDCLFVCGISLTSGQLVSELFPDLDRHERISSYAQHPFTTGARRTTAAKAAIFC